jgi:hypothetical protein
MPKLKLSTEQRKHLVAKFGITPSTLSEICYFRRPACKRHAEIAAYAVNELGATVVED